MKIATFHNYYKRRGGEDAVFELQNEILSERGHEVFSYEVRNENVFQRSQPLRSALTSLSTPNNPWSKRDVGDFLDRVKPEISHVHNWFPAISPSIYHAHLERNIPVVQTLHNYRLGCAAATFRHGGESCQQCLSGDRWAAVKKKCYRNSSVGSLMWKLTMDKSWKNGTFTHENVHYVSPSSHVKALHVKMGLSEHQVSHIPNACKDPLKGQIPAVIDRTGDVVFLGRLVAEKGVDTLLRAWKTLQESGSTFHSRKLSIIGSGPELEHLKRMALDIPNVVFHGQLKHDDAMKRLKEASTLVFPSRWDEPFGLGIIEAMALGRPVIASDLGAPSELIQHGESGLLIQPDDSIALSNSLESLLRDPQKMNEMGQTARSAYLAKFHPTRHVQSLEELYEQIIFLPESLSTKSARSPKSLSV